MRFLPLCPIAGIPLLLGTLQAQQPELVAPGVVSTDRNETFPAIDPRDGSLWYSVYDRRFDRQTIMRAPPRGETWDSATVAPFSGEHGDRASRFSPDGGRLYFTSSRPAQGYPPGDMNIWMVTRGADGSWAEPELVGAPVSVPGGNDMHSVALADGTLFLASSRPGGAGRSDIYRVSPDRGVERLEEPINDAHSQPDLFVSPDGRRMILVVTDFTGGLGGDDLFASSRRDGAWTAPHNLGAPINSAEYEYGPTVSPDGRWLYFTSHRRGNADIYRVPLEDVSFAP